MVVKSEHVAAMSSYLWFVYWNLCAEFNDICDKHPHTTWGKIPEARVAYKKKVEFVKFVDKYLGFRLVRTGDFAHFELKNK